MTVKVLYMHRLAPEVRSYLEEGLMGQEVEIRTPLGDEKEDLFRELPDADILIGWRSDLEMLSAAKKMKLFINPGTGINQHLENFRELRKTREVILVNGHGNSYAVAQHTVALLLSLSNKVIPYHQKMVLGEKRGPGQRTVYMKGLTIGLLGYGAINSKVHRFLSGFDVNFVVCRRSQKNMDDTSGIAKTYSPDQLEEFFGASDIVINSLPTTQATKEMVDKKALEKLGESGLFVNVGRGATVKQEDLYHALKDRVIAGAALEVWWGKVPEEERVDPDRNDPFAFPFHELDNIVMSPHRGADMGGDLERWEEVVENITRFAHGREDFLNVVDIDAEY